jgi:hypothetical protein
MLAVGFYARNTRGQALSEGIVFVHPVFTLSG